jgi:hypothetical protein
MKKKKKQKTRRKMKWARRGEGNKEEYGEEEKERTHWKKVRRKERSIKMKE